MRVTDLISKEDIANWKSGSVITIAAGTGVGKSFFVKNSVYDYAKAHGKKILFLIHRVRCIEQFLKEIERDGKSDVIDIKTYQHIEAKFIYGTKFDFSEYMYIVCDEMHYWLEDSLFNKNTELSLNAILEQTNKVRILMSATGEMVIKYINKFKNIETIDYEIPSNFNFINKLNFFTKDSLFESVIEDVIEQNKKAIVFIQSAKRAYQLHKKFKKHSLFNCGKSDPHYRYVKEDKIEQLLIDEKFNENILITTAAMDAGVNIIDKDLTHVICDIQDTSTLIQCIGRKRQINKEDKINLYIKTITNQQLGAIKSHLNKRSQKAKYLRNHTVSEYIQKYQRDQDNSGIIYDEIIDGETNKVTKKINYLMYSKIMIDAAEIETMLQRGDYGYCKYIAEKFGFLNDLDQYTYGIVDMMIYDKDLVEYLDENVGKKLFKEEQKNLKEAFQANGLKARSLGINTLNGNLRDRKLPYLILSKKTNISIDGKVKSVRYWELAKDIATE